MASIRLSPDKDAGMPKEPDFAIGDKVVANDGSQVMTIQEIYDPVFIYRYRCAWLDTANLPQHELFRHEQLEPADQ
jgi:uncharacterized protein YodC (DUF2158 family)